MVYALSYNAENRVSMKRWGVGGGRGISGIIYIKNGLDGMFDSKRDFPLQDH